MNRKIRAVIAGFEKFFPIPPKRPFTTTIAKRHPMIACQSGKLDGTLNAISGKVSDRLFLMNDSVKEVLEEYAGCNAYDRQQQGPETENVDAGDPCRSECQKHRSHQPCGIRFRYDMR